MGGAGRALCGEGGGERRGNSLPCEGLPPCVAPYFATRGRGDMRGGRGGVPPKSPPRRWWQAVASTMVLRATCCVSRGVARRVVWCDDGLPPPPGWHHGGAHRWPSHVADTQVGEIRGYARLPSPPGIDNTSPLRKRCGAAQVREERGTRRRSGGYPHTYACRRYAPVALGRL